MRVWVVLNTGSRLLLREPGADWAGRLASAFAAAGAQAEILSVNGAGVDAAARKALAAAPDAVVAGGGDGTISRVAAVLAGTGVPLGVLPLGTLNHFAQQLKLPTEPAEAAAVIARGRAITVDVGTVNGHVFINNASIGVYPWAVRRREGRLAAVNTGKWRAMAAASAAALWRFPMAQVRVTLPGTVLTGKTPFVFIGNNEYRMDLRGLGTRARLDGGRLSLYVPRHDGRRGLLRLMARAITGLLDERRDLRAFTTSVARIDSLKAALDVAIDGEVVRLKPPLEFSIQPGALRVLAPPPIHGRGPGGESA